MAAVDTLTQARPAAAPAGQPFFEAKGVEALYGESYIVQGVSFDVKKGEVVALLGRNGAGKTSTLRTIARADAPQLRRGTLRLGEHDLTRMSAAEAARVGVQLVPEDRRIIPGLTVEENLKLAQIAEPKGWELDQIYERFPRLAERRRQEATTMSGGEQQMLAVARALAREIRLLLLDEPYEGLAPVIVQEIERIVGQIKDLGITTIMVEQNAIAALHLADRAIIMDMGEIVHTGTAKDVLDNKELREEYLAV